MLAEWIFLYGPPGSGKSALGQRLAEALGLPFLDLDEQVERAGGASIPELFATRREAGFRQIERQTLSRALMGPPGVMALGGGSLLDESSRELVEARGRLVCLSAGRPVLLKRLRDSATKRPLLDGNLEQKLSELLNQRAAHYASFPRQVATDDLSLDDSVWQVQTRLGRFRVSGMRAPYYVRFSDGSLDELGEVLRPYARSSMIIVVADAQVAGLYAEKVLHSLSSAGWQAELLTFPAGEQHKTIATVQALWEGFLQAGLPRRGMLVALGGGVTTDLAGFAAATYMRGVDWVAVPTTLLAMVDASLGGKTGADLPQGKNLVGAFHSPRLVLADSQVLSSLPASEVRNGMAEVVKAGIIADPRLFEACAAGIESLQGSWLELIPRSMAVKLRLVQEDPFEQGRREALNLGHTIGHAIERLSGYTISHGEAVAMGLVAEARLAEIIGLAQDGLASQISAVLGALKLPVEIPAWIIPQELVSAMQVDKKRQAAELRFSLPAAIGDVRTGICLKPEEIISILNRERETQI